MRGEVGLKVRQHLQFNLDHVSGQDAFVARAFWASDLGSVVALAALVDIPSFAVVADLATTATTGPTAPEALVRLDTSAGGASYQARSVAS